MNNHISEPFNPKQNELGLYVRTASFLGKRRSNQDRILIAGSIVAIADGVGGATRGDAAAQTALGRIAIESALINPRIHPEQAIREIIRAADKQAQHTAQVFGAEETSTTLSLFHATLWSNFANDSAEDTPLWSSQQEHENRITPTEAHSNEMTTPVPLEFAAGEQRYNNESQQKKALDQELGEVLGTFAWVGDSPIFLVRGDHVEQISKPHTLAPSHHAGDGFALDRAVGGYDAKPDIRQRRLRCGDRVILASDGILDIPGHIRHELMASGHSASKCLIQFSRAMSEYSIGDNTTVAIIDITASAPRERLTHLLS